MITAGNFQERLGLCLHLIRRSSLKTSDSLDTYRQCRDNNQLLYDYGGL